MPVYESETISRDELEKVRKKNTCAVCGGWLNTFYDLIKHKAFIACNDWPRTHHEGIAREAYYGELNYEARREQMTQELGVTKSRALARYATPGTVMTRDVASEIIETLWKDAPPVEKLKAIIICQQYNLNPLMKHLYLVKYNRYEKGEKVGEDWTIMQGIQSTRLMARRRHTFSYLDMTPRIATKEEIQKTLGDTAKTNYVYSITKIKDLETGAEAYGIKGRPKDDKVHGADKGNTPLNMACIQSERQAIDRLYPGEMPANVEAIDEQYIEGEYRDVDTTTGEITEGKKEKHAKQPEPPLGAPPQVPHPPEGEGEGKVAEEGKQGSGEQELELPDIPYSVKGVTEAMTRYGWTIADVKAFVKEEKWTASKFAELTLEQLTTLIDFMARNHKKL